MNKLIKWHNRQYSATTASVAMPMVFTNTKCMLLFINCIDKVFYSIFNKPVSCSKGKSTVFPLIIRIIIRKELRASQPESKSYKSLNIYIIWNILVYNNEYDDNNHNNENDARFVCSVEEISKQIQWCNCIPVNPVHALYSFDI